MTITTNLSSVTLNGNGTTTSFPFDFWVPTDEELQFWITDASGILTQTTNCTVTLSGSGGTVVYPAVGGTVLPSGAKITIMRDMAFTQTLDLVNAATFHAEVIESALDRLTAQIQQVDEAVGRSVKVTVSSTTSPDDLLAEIAVDVAGAAAAVDAAETAQGLAEDARDAAAASAVESAAFIPDLANDSDPLKGAGLIGFMGRTVGEHLGDYVNLKDYSAVGDGTTDDSTAIATALNYAIDNRRALYVPSGRYLMNSQVIVHMGGLSGQDGCSIYGDGEMSSLFIAAKANTSGCIKILMDDNSCNVVVKGVGFGSMLDNTNTAERDAPNGAALWIVGPYAPGEAGFGSHATYNAVIQNVFIGGHYVGVAGIDAGGYDRTGSWAYGIRLDYLWYPLLENVWIHGLSNINTTTYDPATRVAGINIAGVQLNTCFSPFMDRVSVVGYFDYGINHLGVSTTGNAEQGGWLTDSMLVSQRVGLNINHSNTIAPVPAHDGFLVSGCHINSCDYGAYIRYRREVHFVNSYFYVAHPTWTALSLPSTVYIDAASSVQITGCGFYSTGFYTSNTVSSVAVNITANALAGVSLTGCQILCGGIGVLNDSAYVSYARGCTITGQTTGAWATRKPFVDNTGTLVISAGASANVAEERLISQATSTAPRPKYALVSERTDYAANTTGVLGAHYYQGLDSTATERTAAAAIARWTDNTAASYAGRLEFWTSVATAIAKRMTVANGVYVGGPTGGDKGSGTINAASGVYLNGVDVRGRDGGYKTGQYYPPYGIYPAATSGAAVANRVVYEAFVVTKKTTFTKIGIEVVTGSGSVARLGIYKMTNGVPGALILDCGTVATDGTAIVEATISQELDVGAYFLGFICDDTPTLRTGSTNPQLIADILGTTQISAATAFTSYYQAGSGTALPSPAGSVTAGASAFMIWLRS